MKTNKFLRIASVLLIAVLLSTCVISGTFAKYTSSVSLTGSTATVAKWSIEVEGEEIAVTGSAPVIAFDLFGTVVDTVDGNDDAHVKENLIAPGTKGAFELNVANKSEVVATYAIDYTVTKNAAAENLPIKFSVDGGQSWTDTLDDVAATTLAMETGTAAINVQWKWDFERTEIATNDPIDTGFGIAAQTAAPTITVTAAVTATQVD